MNSGVLICVTLAAFGASAGGRVVREAELKAKLPEVFAKSAEHHKALDKAAVPLSEGKNGVKRYPHRYDPVKRKLVTHSIYQKRVTS
jgi:hypothetical protein